MMSKLYFEFNTLSDWFAGIAFVLRALGGMGDATLSIAGYSVITILFPRQKMLYLGFCSTARGFGCMLGPIFGQIIFSLTGYSFCETFFIFATFISLFMILAWIILPESLNKQ
jgi:MFS family permease